MQGGLFWPGTRSILLVCLCMTSLRAQVYAKAALANLVTVYKWKRSQRIFLMPGSQTQGVSPLWTCSGHRPLATKGIHRRRGKGRGVPSGLSWLWGHG